MGMEQVLLRKRGGVEDRMRSSVSRGSVFPYHAGRRAGGVLETDFQGIRVQRGSFLEFIPMLPTHPSGIFLQGAPQVGIMLNFSVCISEHLPFLLLSASCC